MLQEIAEILSRQSGRSIIEVWDEALSLHSSWSLADVLADEEE